MDKVRTGNWDKGWDSFSGVQHEIMLAFFAAVKTGTCHPQTVGPWSAKSEQLWIFPGEESRSPKPNQEKTDRFLECLLLTLLRTTGWVLCLQESAEDFLTHLEQNLESF